MTFDIKNVSELFTICPHTFIHFEKMFGGLFGSVSRSFSLFFCLKYKRFVTAQNLFILNELMCERVSVCGCSS